MNNRNVYRYTLSIWYFLLGIRTFAEKAITDTHVCEIDSCHVGGAWRGVALARNGVVF